MSAHVSSFPFDAPYNRDLSDFELWERSLRRSVHRREITEAARKHAARRKGAALAVSASMAAGPTAAPFAAIASARRLACGRDRERRAALRRRTCRRSALVSEGDTGAAVAAVQRQVGVDDDGIFGPITRAAVSSFQKRYGLPVTGSVDARTWTALFKSNVSFVGGGGKSVMTVYQGGAAKAPRRRTARRPPRPRSAAPGRRRLARRRRSARRRPARPRPRRPPPTRPRTARRRPSRSPPLRLRRPSRQPAVAGRARSAPRSAVQRPAPTARPAPATATPARTSRRPTGTAVRAAQCGTVTQASADGSGYGNLVCIQHAGGVSTCYAHLSEITTTKGAYVHVGDVDRQGRLHRQLHAARTCTSRSARTARPSTPSPT